MNAFDIVVTIFLLYGFIRGLVKGLLLEVASLVALIAGVYGAIHFSYFIGDWLKDSVSWDEKYISLTAFGATFVVIIVAISLLGKALTKIADFAALGLLNMVLGGVFGAVKTGLILSIIFIFFGKMNDTLPFVEKETLEESILFHPVKKIAPTIFPSIIKDGDVEKLKDKAIEKIISK